MQIFNTDFLKLDSNLIINDIQKKGFFCFEKALSDDFISAITNSVEENRTGLTKTGHMEFF